MSSTRKISVELPHGLPDAEGTSLRLVSDGAPSASQPREGSANDGNALDGQVGQIGQIRHVFGLLPTEVSDACVVAGFESTVHDSRSWIHPTSMRIRARIAAAELVLLGFTKPRHPQIAACIGRSGRTVIDHLDGFDSVFAFPPPELAPVVVDAWSTSDSPEQFGQHLAAKLEVFGRNPIACRLFASVALVHALDRSRRGADGHFALALDEELERRGLDVAELTRWTGFLTDAFRRFFVQCAESQVPLVAMVPGLVEALRPMAFPRSSRGLTTKAG
jgi:hypothetical protein